MLNLVETTDTLTILPPEKKIWSDVEFMALPDDGHHYEIINGELIDMGNSGALHGYVAIILSSALFAVVSSQKLGAIFDSSTAFKMKNGNKRSPDISFFAKARLQGMTTLPSGYLEGSPDLVVEVLSPGNTVEEIDDKLTEYFDNGTRLAWVIHPLQHYILVYHSAQEPEKMLRSIDSLKGEDIVPGFSLPVADLFQNLSF